mgnify:CR=1 FL=1
MYKSTIYVELNEMSKNQFLERFNDETTDSIISVVEQKSPNKRLYSFIRLEFLNVEMTKEQVKEQIKDKVELFRRGMPFATTVVAEITEYDLIS